MPIIHYNHSPTSNINHNINHFNLTKISKITMHILEEEEEEELYRFHSEGIYMIITAGKTIHQYYSN